MVLALFGFGSLFWCSFAVMTLLTLACWPILSTRAVAQARVQAPSGTGGA